MTTVMKPTKIEPQTTLKDRSARWIKYGLKSGPHPVKKMNYLALMDICTMSYGKTEREVRDQCCE